MILLSLALFVPLISYAEESGPDNLTFETLNAMTIESVVSNDRYLRAASSLEPRNLNEARWQLLVMLGALDITNKKLEDIITKLRTLINAEAASTELKQYKDTLESVRMEQQERVKKIRRLNQFIQETK